MCLADVTPRLSGIEIMSSHGLVVSAKQQTKLRKSHVCLKVAFALSTFGAEEGVGAPKPDKPPSIYPIYSSRTSLLLQTPNTQAHFHLPMFVYSVPSKKMSAWLIPPLLSDPA